MHIVKEARVWSCEDLLLRDLCDDFIMGSRNKETGIALCESKRPLLRSWDSWNGCATHASDREQTAIVCAASDLRILVGEDAARRMKGEEMEEKRWRRI